jgi:hypothetical protein
MGLSYLMPYSFGIILLAASTPNAIINQVVGGLPPLFVRGVMQWV